MNSTFETPCRSTACRAAPTMAGDRSTAVTDPAFRADRRASGMTSLPAPQPNSRMALGLKYGLSCSSIARNIDATSASPLSKKARSCSGVRFWRRNCGEVRTAKYGSRAANRSQRGSGSFAIWLRLDVHPGNHIADLQRLHHLRAIRHLAEDGVLAVEVGA